MICRVELDVTGWQAMDNRATWQTVACDEMKLQLAEMPLPFPPQSGLEQVREFFRHVVTRRKGALISSDPVQGSDLPLFKTVYKYPAGRGQAVTFEASLAVPLGNVCLELLITASEDSITGVREALVMRDLMKTAGVSEREQLARNEIPIDWKFERYHPGTRRPWAYVISDSEQYDAAYPRHPLSRVRRWLRRIERTYRVVVISESAQNQIQIQTLPLKPMTFEEMTRELGFDVASDAMTAEAFKKLATSFPPLANRQKTYRDQRDAELKKVMDVEAKVQSIRKSGEQVAAELTPDSAKLILARIRASGHWLIQPENGRLALTAFTAWCSSMTIPKPRNCRAIRWRSPFGSCFHVSANCGNWASIR